MESYVRQFLTLLTDNPTIETISYQDYAGIPFLSIQVREFPTYSVHEIRNHLMDWIKDCAYETITGTVLSFECKFIRKSKHGYVFRFRFLVPNEKMFCCGNLCDNCILKK